MRERKRKHDDAHMPMGGKGNRARRPKSAAGEYGVNPRTGARLVPMTANPDSALRQALVAAEKIVALMDELTDAVDLEADDIGTGARSSLVILREIGPLIAPTRALITEALQRGEKT